MCVQDWRIGRLIRAQSSSTVLGVGQTLTIPSNKQRVGITFDFNDQITAIGSFIEVRVDGNQFTILWSVKPIIHWTVATHGDLSMREISFTTVATGATMGVIEYFLPEEFLTAGLEEFKKEVGL